MEALNGERSEDSKHYTPILLPLQKAGNAYSLKTEFQSEQAYLQKANDRKQ
jgi:hypothetical protein